MDGAADLLALLPEVQEALSDEFDGIECSIGPGPDLSQSPFRLEVPHLGRQITFIPDIAHLDDFDSSGLHRINLSKTSALFTDGQSSCCLELILGRGRNWRDPLIKLFDKLYPNKWAFFIVELEQSQPTYHLLCCNSPVISTRREDTPDSTEPSSQISSPPESVAESSNFSLWIVPVTRVFALPPLPQPKKVRIVKKIVKKRTPNEDVYDENGDKKKLNVTSNVSKVRAIRKKLEKKEDEAPAAAESPKPAMTNGTSSPIRSSPEVSTTPEKSEKSTLEKSAEKVVTRSSLSRSPTSNGVDSNAGTSNSVTPERKLIDESEYSSISDLRKKLMESSESTSGLSGERWSTVPPRVSTTRKSLTPDRRLDPIYEGDRKSRIKPYAFGHFAKERGQERSIPGSKESLSDQQEKVVASSPKKEKSPEGKGQKKRSVSPAKIHEQEVVCRANGTSAEMPVLCLQLILSNYFTYEQLGHLRAVHPHWDEICGQLLNSGYYKLLERSDKLLMALQRKLPADPGLHFPTTVLTNIQVHILNSVDIMRAVLDEGVCCFPYGVILDKTNVLLDQVEFMMKGGDQDTVKWEPVALLAKKAALHYRTCMERTMEERLGEGLRLKAAQRIIRLDSFLVESTVSKLEKDATKARDELKWELEQLQQQNTQLRKDNRQLKIDHMRLESRVEVLEQKFKTLARLLS
ncbi:hypothetical protein RB195_006717 [Necator americanus]|uniref:Uncharacterized protein n=1 Tax=Necator americanus TaxID=51031 RepID=A0ABR1BTW3_NECAM